MKKTIKLVVENNHNILKTIGKITTGLYNTANYQRIKEWKDSGKIPNYYDQCFDLKDNHLSRLLFSQVAQQTLKELNNGYKSWYSLRKTDPEAKPPKFRKKNTPVSIWWTPFSFKILSDKEIQFNVKNLDIPENFIVCKISSDSRFNLSEMNVKMINISFDKNTIFANIYFEFEEPTQLAFDNIIAIDLGINNIVASVNTNGNSEIIAGGEILSHQRYANKKTAELQSILDKTNNKKESDAKKTKKPKDTKAIKTINQKSSRQIKHKLHVITKHIAEQALVFSACVVIGDLKDIRQNKRKKEVENANGDLVKKRVIRKNEAQKLNSWSYNTFTSFLTYKCLERGIQIFKVSERNTSKTCSNCGVVKKSNRVKRGLYRCDCGYCDNADINGANNILMKFLDDPEKNVSLSDLSQRVVAGGTSRSMIKLGFQGLSC